MRARAELSDERRRSLELVEEGIIADPHGRLSRRDGPGGTIIDTSERFLIVTYQLDDDEVPRMLDVLDLTR
jgi:hypothetical protein